MSFSSSEKFRLSMITDWHIRFGSFLSFTLFRSFSSAWLGAPHSFPSPSFSGFPFLPFLLLPSFFIYSPSHKVSLLLPILSHLSLSIYIYDFLPDSFILPCLSPLMISLWHSLPFVPSLLSFRTLSCCHISFLSGLFRYLLFSKPPFFVQPSCS